MNSIALLLILEILLLSIAMLMSQCDILAPSVIVNFMFFVSTSILSTNIIEWGVCISFTTTLVIFVALLSFTVISYFVMKLSKVNYHECCLNIPILNISRGKMIMSVVFEAFICFVYYKEVVRIASYVTQDWGMGLIWKYRQMVFYTGSLSSEQRMNPWVTQGYKITMIMAYLMLFIFISNVIVNKDRFVKNVKYLALVPAYIFMVILAGNRLAIMNMVFFSVMSWYILKNIKSGFSRKQAFKYIFKFLGIGVTVIVAFWLLTSVVQRYTKLPFWTMVSIYAGAPIQLLDQYIIQPVEPNQVFGQESLINIINSMYKLGLTNYHGILNLEHRTYNGVPLGNVYTTIRRFIQDFGYVGMLISISLISLFYNWFYYNRIKRINRITYKNFMRIIIYAFMSYPLFLFSIEEYFTLMWSVGYIITLVLFYLLFFFYTKVSISNFKIQIKKEV